LPRFDESRLSHFARHSYHHSFVRVALNMSVITLRLTCLMHSAGYPLITYFTRHPLSTLGGFNIGGINATGQVPKMPGNWGLIDLDTPQSAYTIASFNDPTSTWQLVFSDEFNTDGRTFYPGDDPYWEAADLHYWAVNCNFPSPRLLW
jgi:beta-glucan synthesis-associated protein KRE6